mmetsp:Transcript_9364/g.15564  ORF Transcript_9364/g.15564 Transcript_9364/m.15564 type:complete len:368 (-) Transcript_9364:211-1314(-)
MTSAHHIIAKVLSDASLPPTTDATSERYLAVAMGYPTTWRVSRQILSSVILDNNTKDDHKIGSTSLDKDCSLSTTNKNESIRSGAYSKTPSSTIIIQDVIYAGNPKKGVDRWYCHEAAMLASVTWEGNPYAHKGGHLTKIVPQFAKGDAVEVKYGKKWFAAKVSKRKEVQEGFKYSVVYTVDESTQDNVRETSIRMAPPSATAKELAASMGFPQDWEATKNGRNFLFTSPDGQTFRSKKAALKYVRESTVEAEDPPWRTAGHELMNRRIVYEHFHKLGRARHVTIDQTGKIVGWIAETDTDRNGEPGYVSEDTGKAASLFHIAFEDQPGHPYGKHLIDSIDMEEEEVRKLLIEEDADSPRKKRARLR